MKLRQLCSAARRPTAVPRHHCLRRAAPPLLLILTSLLVAVSARAGNYLVYVGTYDTPKTKGIYAFRFTTETGQATAPSLVAEITNPTFLELHPEGPFLYAVNEIGRFRDKDAGAASAFRIDKQTGRLALLNQVSSVGAGPCHLAVDRTGHCLVVANYGGGSVAAFPIKNDGSLGEATSFFQHQGKSVNAQRQQGPHAHGVTFDPAEKFAFVPDLGTDKIMIYRLDARAAKLTPNDPPAASLPPGSGPRHLAFHPNGRFAYAVNELASTVTVFAFDEARGSLTERQTISTLPDGFSGNSTTAEIAVHPRGKFLYVSNRGYDSIAAFGIARNGTLKRLDHVSTQGKTPRHFAIDPTGEWLWAGNQGTDTLVLFRIDPKAGTLLPGGQALELGAPVCVKYLALTP